ncbi:MAG: DPP IV N-terminal domain-containing protein [Candidatus Geothermincolia bacterium]
MMKCANGPAIVEKRSARTGTVLAWMLLALLICAACLPGCGGGGGPAAGPVSGGLTARQLEEPNALVGPGPSNLIWSPKGTQLAYASPQGSGLVLSLYDASDGSNRVILDPAGHPDNIDVTTAQWSPRGDSILLVGEKSLWLLQVGSGSLKSLATTDGDRESVAFSPSADRISYVVDNDIYTVHVGSGRVDRLTTDGTEDIYNGTLDWVYTEELATRTSQPAYAWSPDGARLVYLRLDDSAVQNHSVTDYDPVPPTISYTRYPVTGTANPKASLHVLTLDGSKPAQTVQLPQGTEYILPFFTWAPDSREADFITVSRDQKVLQLNAWDPAGGSNRVVIKETDPDWINENMYAAPIFLGDGQRFLWLSERDGFMHLYLFARDGKLEKQLTKGNWLIDTLAYDLIAADRPVDVDPQGTWAYFATTKNGPLVRQIYRVNTGTGRLEQLTKTAGFHAAILSGDGRYLAEQFSSGDTPPVTSIFKSDGTGASVLAKCAGPAVALPDVHREFVKVKAHDGVELEAQIVKPANFDPKQRYGVVVHWYGGPGLQLVSNRYGTTNIFNSIERDVLYTQQGFIVWRLDNRGSYGRGHAFETPVYGHLGPAALDDQLAGVEYLKGLPYVDAGRIGTDGKSFGGFLTLYALIHAPGVFQCGVAGSAPTSWKYYDTIYTERYMGTPAGNPTGYSETDLISRAQDLKAKPLIIHGLADTNVHLQNSVNFIQALEQYDKAFDFIPLPNEDHHYQGDGLVAALAASTSYFALHMGKK